MDSWIRNTVNGNGTVPNHSLLIYLSTWWLSRIYRKMFLWEKKYDNKVNDGASNTILTLAAVANLLLLDDLRELWRIYGREWRGTIHGGGGGSLRTVLVQGHAHGESGLNGAEPKVMKRGLCYTCANKPVLASSFHWAKQRRDFVIYRHRCTVVPMQSFTFI
jgi:hypothetical protein